MFYKYKPIPLKNYKRMEGIVLWKNGSIRTW